MSMMSIVETDAGALQSTAAAWTAPPPPPPTTTLERLGFILVPDSTCLCTTSQSAPARATCGWCKLTGCVVWERCGKRVPCGQTVARAGHQNTVRVRPYTPSRVIVRICDHQGVWATPEYAGRGIHARGRAAKRVGKEWRDVADPPRAP